MDERKMFDATLVELSQRDEETFDKPFPNDDINVLWALWQVARRTTPDREAIVEEIAEMVDHMGEGRRLEEYVGAIREMKSGDKGGA
ncbi:TPA: hypothetical protein QDB07_003581 [Burkholderia vietnamiensis]|nr:hypothetical protein [Burkholderia vietnamiensis]